MPPQPLESSFYYQEANNCRSQRVIDQVVKIKQDQWSGLIDSIKSEEANEWNKVHAGTVSLIKRHKLAPKTRRRLDPALHESALPDFDLDALSETLILKLNDYFVGQEQKKSFLH